MARRQKLVCNACRQRKSRCDGATPSCSNCAATGRQCHYDKAPSLAYVRALQERIQMLESRQAVPKEGSVPLNFAGQDEESISVDARGDLSYHNLTSAIHETPSEKESASTIGAPPSSSSLSTTTTTATPSGTEQVNGVEIRRALVAHTTAQRQQEDQHLDLIATHTDIPGPLARTLLELYWCWLHTSFLFVYRPTFTRDMPLLVGQGDGARRSYCSDTLLKVVYAHSCRFVRDPESTWDPLGRSETFEQFADRLMSEAQVALAMETINPPSIPTIQALLQQSARDMAYGRSSQAWLYSGMAFRMAIDLGIHVSTERLQRYARWLSPEDIEVRKRLFWSLYAWDKHISLYLGRMPNFLAGTNSIPLEFLDDYTETEPWKPFYGSERLDNRGDYPPIPGHVVSCFTALCKLCKILSRLMLELYSPETHKPKAEPVQDFPKMAAFVAINEELQTWRTGLPPFLKIDPQNIPSISPPHHITSLNLMYHTTLILLHRPHVAGQRDLNAPAVQRSWKICKTAMRAIHDILQLYVGTLGFSHITYMNSYCTYTAATTAVYQLEIDDEQQKTIGPTRNSIWTELKFLLDILQRTAVSMTGLNRSIDIIRSRLKKILDRRAASQLQSLFPPALSSQRMPSQSSQPPFPLSYFQSPEPTFSDARPTLSATPYLLPRQSQSNPLNPGPQTETPLNQVNTNLGAWASWLPAFPGQDVSLGTESLFDCEAGLSPDTRCALMGSNLDPHLSLDYPLTGEAMDEYSRFTEGL
ncbi:hypothetical protein SI65_07746 [Aspergillus cristatus]|uniref:Zn(2)-C6 fungal-type domain-containing protein n=1 Tax=Aspergillus cristatus TaxID=573508 RepID=A0A1E3B7M4_ASPCR|nr:hypothetical protein SI65_07746 [Aspergillus cristatus]